MPADKGLWWHANILKDQRICGDRNKEYHQRRQVGKFGFSLQDSKLSWEGAQCNLMMYLTLLLAVLNFKFN